MDQTPPPQTVQVTFYSLLDTPILVALFFALAGAFFIGIVLLRRRKK